MRNAFRMAPVAIAVLVAFSVAAHAQTGASAAEQQLFASVNQARQEKGLAALRWNEALATAARRHAAWMAKRGEVEHAFPGEPALPARATQAGAKFVSLAENVARGATVGAIDDEFLQSANHRANMLDPEMDSIGVGVVERGGKVFAVIDFSKAR